MRALGAYLNVFAIESFMDELAAAAGADPVRVPARPPRPTRGRRTSSRPRPGCAGWSDPLPDDTGRGLGFARYKDTGAWCAVVAEVEVATRRPGPRG